MIYVVFPLAALGFIFSLSAYSEINKLKKRVKTLENKNKKWVVQDADFVNQASELEVPVYYMIGRHDYTARFIEEYFEVLEAPKKELFWFENSAHGEIWTEADKFHDIMVKKVLLETYK